MRILKLTGVIVIASLVSAVMVSAAPAATYKSETATTYFTATNEKNLVFKAGLTMECTSFTASGEFTSGATSLTLTNVAISGCKLGGQSITWDMNGCDYRSGEPTGAASPFTVKNVTLECPAGKEVVATWTSSNCTFKLKPQTMTGTSTATNNIGPPKTVTVDLNLSNIVVTGSGGACGGVVLNASTTGKLKLSGFSDAAHTKATGIFVA